ncbi:hypothetical protein R5R35_004831 [Gryllus longicercus]|uniref:Uncharacterized protein n=1 Tax=Gryllus longicercus TaxID=2509291 RepID=A0AAN9ZAA7_9ORTH
MEEINILSESIIKIESVKEEPVDVNDDDCWNDYFHHVLFCAHIHKHNVIEEGEINV